MWIWSQNIAKDGVCNVTVNRPEFGMVYVKQSPNECFKNQGDGQFLWKETWSRSSITQSHCDEVSRSHCRNNLYWDPTAQYINKTATKRIHFLRAHRGYGLSSEELFLFYKSLIRPICKCQVWPTSLTKEQSGIIEFEDNIFQACCIKCASAGL